MIDPIIHEKIAVPLAPAIGHVLNRAIYRCLNWECTYESVEGPLFGMGGELDLRFEDATIFISWSRRGVERWDREYGVHYFVEASVWEPFFDARGIEPFDATRTALWSPVIGTRLQKLEVLGWDGIPFILNLCFGGGTVLVGTGNPGTGREDWGFGDSDDVLVRSQEEYGAYLARWAGRSDVLPPAHIATIDEELARTLLAGSAANDSN